MGEVLLEIARKGDWNLSRLAEKLTPDDPSQFHKWITGPDPPKKSTPTPERIDAWVERLQALGPRFDGFIPKIREARRRQKEDEKAGRARAPRPAANPATDLPAEVLDGLRAFLPGLTSDEDRRAFRDLLVAMSKTPWRRQAHALMGAVDDIATVYRRAIERSEATPPETFPPPTKPAPPPAPHAPPATTEGQKDP